MHRVNVAISFGNEEHLPGAMVDLSHWPQDDIARLEQEWHVTEQAFAIDHVTEPPAPPSNEEQPQ